MLEMVLAKQKKITDALKNYKNDDLITFFNRFSKVTNSGVVITPKDPLVENSFEVANFNGDSFITLSDTTNNPHPYDLKNGNKFVLETYLTPRSNTQQALFGNLLNITGTGSLFFIINNTYYRNCKISLNVRHASSEAADNLGITRYRFGLDNLLTNNLKVHIKVVCDGSKVTAYFNGEKAETYDWYGATTPQSIDFCIGKTLDTSFSVDKLMLNALLEGFRFLKY